MEPAFFQGRQVVNKRNRQSKQNVGKIVVSVKENNRAWKG